MALGLVLDQGKISVVPTGVPGGASGLGPLTYVGGGMVSGTTMVMPRVRVMRPHKRSAKTAVKAIKTGISAVVPIYLGFQQTAAKIHSRTRILGHRHLCQK